MPVFRFLVECPAIPALAGHEFSTLSYTIRRGLNWSNAASILAWKMAESRLAFVL